MDALKLKAELLCYGMSADDATIKLFKKQNPNEIWRTGSNGCFLEFDNTQVLASMMHGYNDISPYKFSIKNKCLLRNNRVVKTDVNATVYPDWWTQVELSTGRSFSDVFLFEGEGFFHQAYKGCDYMENGIGCIFCSIGARCGKDITPSEYGEAAGIIKSYMPTAKICLGGGTYLPISKNVQFFIDCTKEIRMRNPEIPIWVEMVPPQKEDVLRLVDAGITSFNFNIEIWDDKKRKVFCPGKSEITLNHYLDVLEFSAKLLPNRVGSSFIAGLDSNISIKTGIDKLVSIGVCPCILPFRPFSGSLLESFRSCDPNEFVELNYYAIEQIYINDLDLLKGQGCVLCGCCTIMQDIWQKNYSKMKERLNNLPKKLEQQNLFSTV